MASYAPAPAAGNINRTPHTPNPAWSLRRRLAAVARAAERDTPGAGTRRRRTYEHQLDDHLTIIDACHTGGAIITVDRSARLRSSAAARRAARARTAVLACQTIEPAALLAEALGRRDSFARSTARTIGHLLPQIAALHPANTSWAIEQAPARAQRIPTATRYYLPRRAWTTFTEWRRLVRAVTRLLLMLYRMLSALIPLRRDVAPKAKPEETRRSAPAQSRAGTTYGDQQGVPVTAAWFLARPFPGM